MKLKILTGDWEILETEEELYAETMFPERVIRYNMDFMWDEQTFRHCMIHELTHAYIAELGQAQNSFSNGKRQDEFDSEWICEFVAIYLQDILSTYDKIKHLYNVDR